MRFTAETRINAPVEEVWQTLADIGAIHLWNPGVVNSYLTTEKAGGVGAGRRCELGGKNYLREEVIGWEVGRRLTVRVVETNLPFKAVDISFGLRADGHSTVVTLSPEYELKFGVWGRLLDRVYVRGSYRRRMAAVLKGLKRYVEEGRAQTPRRQGLQSG